MEKARHYSKFCNGGNLCQNQNAQIKNWNNLIIYQETYLRNMVHFLKKIHLLSHKVSQSVEEAIFRAVGNCYTIK